MSLDHGFPGDRGLVLRLAVAAEHHRETERGVSVAIPREWCWGSGEVLPRSGTVLFKVRYVGLAAFVRDGVDIAPPRGDEPEVSAAVFPLDEGAHDVFAEAVTDKTAVSWALDLTS